MLMFASHVCRDPEQETCALAGSGPDELKFHIQFMSATSRVRQEPHEKHRTFLHDNSKRCENRDKDAPTLIA